MSIYEGAERLIAAFWRVLERYPLIAIILVVVLGILLFLSSVKLGNHIGDAIWR